MCLRIYTLLFTATALFTLGNCNLPQLNLKLPLQLPLLNEKEIKSEPVCRRESFLKAISKKEIENHFKEFKDAIRDFVSAEGQLVKEGKIIRLSDRLADLGKSRRYETDPSTRRRELKQKVFEYVSEELIRKHKIKDAQEKADLRNLPLEDPYSKKAEEDCQSDLFIRKCNPQDKYRTVDGTCNNLKNPRWGSSFICLKRFLPAQYEGQCDFRRSVAGGPLPEPRDLSTRVHNNFDKPGGRASLLGSLLVQLVAHDLTMVPSTTTTNNNGIQCCVEGIRHPQCAPIKVRKDDPFYSKHGVRCLNFVRSAVCPTCKLGTRNQINQVTAFVDASFLYGNSENITKRLRTYDGTGKLKTEKTKFGEILPPSPEPKNDKCSYPKTNDICFLSGDSRVNQHPTLISLHTMFFREHNRLAGLLKKLNPKWNGEKLFQEARRIVSAVMQVITYNEVLPLEVGEDLMNRFDLKLSNSTTKYDESINPNIYAEFSAAALRLSHTFIDNSVTSYPRLDNGSVIQMRDKMFQPFYLRNKDMMDRHLYGISRVPGQGFDRHLVPDVTNYLFRARGQDFGLDLASINIQRGRDLGLPTYAQMLNFCTNNKVNPKSFEDLKEFVDDQNRRVLKENYKSVKDIDLWTGIVSELGKSGHSAGFVGPCIIALQFRDLKFGDRFYFEHEGQAGSFTYDQIQELKKATLNRLLCLNSNVAEIPRDAIAPISETNPAVKCRNVKDIDLSLWRQK